MLRRLIERRFRDICFKLGASSRHTAIIGPTGSGKTTFARNFVRILHRVYDFVIIDMYGEYTGLRGLGLPVVPPRLPFGPWVRELASLLRPESGGLGMMGVARRAFRRASNWADFIVNIEVERSTKRSWGAEALLDRLEVLIDAGVLVNNAVALPPSCIIDLSQLGEEEKAVTALAILLWIFSDKKSLTKRRFVVVEEMRALLFSGQVPVVVPMMERVRRFNLRILGILQDFPGRGDETKNTLLRQNLVIFDMGARAWQLYLEGIHRDVMALKPYQALVYIADIKKWKKIRIPETLNGT